MDKTPKGMRLHIGLFGRTNVGKSSFLNMMAGQDVAITSPIPGTTTDVVEKTMELLPLGPVVFLDTAGIDDNSAIAGLRVQKAKKIFDRADFVLIITEADVWSDYEERICDEARQRKIPAVVVVNKIDLRLPAESFLENMKKMTGEVVLCSCVDTAKRDVYVESIKKRLIELCPDEFMNAPTILGDLLPPAGVVVMIVPIDLEAPKGRLILPQVQSIRDALDNDAAAMIVKEREYADLLKKLKQPPDLVICDSQVVLKMVADTPSDIKCTTFSILFSRFKGDLIEMAKGAAAIDNLKSGDKILISEACSHHALEDDIGRVKIPRWLRQGTGLNLEIDICSGRDYPENLKEYKLIIHCGACMLTRREMIFRIHSARLAGVPMTNYGICIARLQGVIERVLSPFPAALDAYQHELNSVRKGVKNDCCIK